MITHELKPYLLKVCTILNSHRVEYMIVGGAAVSHYGFNRPSGIGQYRSVLKVDLDFWYNPTIENFEKILNALDELSVDTSDLRKMVFDGKRTFLKIPHENFHTDFLPRMEGLTSFRESKNNADKLTIDGVSFLVISLDDLILNKRAVNRKIDQSDIEELNRLRKKKGKNKGL
jgi:predicted nucleotidyltransferase